MYTEQQVAFAQKMSIEEFEELYNLVKKWSNICKGVRPKLENGLVDMEVLNTTYLNKLMIDNLKALNTLTLVKSKLQKYNASDVIDLVVLNEIIIKCKLLFNSHKEEKNSNTNIKEILKARQQQINKEKNTIQELFSEINKNITNSVICSTPEPTGSTALVRSVTESDDNYPDYSYFKLMDPFSLCGLDETLKKILEFESKISVLRTQSAELLTNNSIESSMIKLLFNFEFEPHCDNSSGLAGRTKQQSELCIKLIEDLHKSYSEMVARIEKFRSRTVG